MKKLPANSEASNVLVGEVDFLVKPITAFIRLQKGVILGDLTEVPIPTRFLFIMMGPAICPGKYHEIGRSISTLMADEVIFASRLGLVNLFDSTVNLFFLVLISTKI